MFPQLTLLVMLGSLKLQCDFAICKVKKTVSIWFYPPPVLHTFHRRENIWKKKRRKEPLTHKNIHHLTMLPTPLEVIAFMFIWAVWIEKDFVYFETKWNVYVRFINTDRTIWKQSSEVSWKNRYVMAC